jgi:hypothetical protein
MYTDARPRRKPILLMMATLLVLLVAVMVAPIVPAHAQTAAPMVTAQAQSQSASVAFPRCTAPNLEVWGGFPAGVAMGSSYYPIELTNVGTFTCQTSGFAGVSAYGGGRQIGAPARWDWGYPRSVVVLAPKGTANVVLQIENVGNYSWSACKKTTVSEFQVFVPGSYTASYLRFVNFQVCSTNQVDMVVRPVKAGVGVPHHL